MILEGTVGAKRLSDGAPSAIRLDRTGAPITTQSGGKYYESVRCGEVFIASNVAAQAVSVALATTYTGLVISNPLGNSKYLSILGCNFALSVAPAAIASLHLLAGYSASADIVHTTPLASPGIRNCLIGGNSCTAKADSAATISTPFYLMSLGSGFTAAALYATTPSWINLDGIFLIPPGGFIAIGALTAVTGFATFIWKEVPNS